MKRKLSRRAKTAKKKRDLKYANSRSREIKRADSQKKRRAAKKEARILKVKTTIIKIENLKQLRKTAVTTVKELKKKNNGT